jgi:hypothetical protein
MALGSRDSSRDGLDTVLRLRACGPTVITPVISGRSQIRPLQMGLHLRLMSVELGVDPLVIFRVKERVRAPYEKFPRV